MTSEADVDPLQLVPHRVKVFKLIYASTSPGATPEDDRTPDDVNTHRQPLNEFVTRHADEFTTTEHAPALR